MVEDNVRDSMRRNVLKRIGAGAAALVGVAQASNAAAAESSGDAAVQEDLDAEPMNTIPAGTWWGVYDGYTTAEYNEYIEGYQFGCNGDQRHKGVDVGASTGNYAYAWGPGKVVGTGYDGGGYNRWMQVYFPSTDQSLTLGHLLDGSQLAVGTWFEKGDYWARVGTADDGLGSPHIHFRAGWGNHGWSPIGPCEDIDPYIVWRDLGNA